MSFRDELLQNKASLIAQEEKRKAEQQELHEIGMQALAREIIETLKIHAQKAVARQAVRTEGYIFKKEYYLVEYSDKYIQQRQDRPVWYDKRFDTLITAFLQREGFLKVSIERRSDCHDLPYIHYYTITARIYL